MRQYSLFLFFLLFFGTTFSQDNDSAYVITSIDIEGNKTTKKHIITRELTFKVGDTLTQQQLAEAEKRSSNNLMNAGLFNFAEVKLVPNGKELATKIEVTERWYIWPSPYFEIAETNFNTWWRNKDFSRTNYGFFVTKENFRGRKESIRLRLILGFTEQLAFQYNVPFFNKKQNLGMEFTTGYGRNREVNYATIDNKREFYKNSNDYVKKDLFFRGKLLNRIGLYNSQSFSLQYSNVEVNDTITNLTNEYLPGSKQQAEFFNFNWYLKRDKRDYIHYPLKGYLVSLEFDKKGLGILDDKLNMLNVFFTFRNHLKLEKRLYAGYGIILKQNFLKQPPYYLQRGLGYGETNLRGYNFYVIDGQAYGLFKSNLKFELIPRQTGNFNMIPTEKFSKFYYSVYFNMFFDAGYVHDELYETVNPLANNLQASGGLGLDLVTYYDMVARLEFSVNKLGESGFFLHFAKAF